MKRTNQVISFFLVLAIIFINISFSPIQVMAKKDTKKWPSAPDIYAETGVLIEASTGTVLYDKNKDQQMYPASITKVLTTLVALENSSLDDIVTFSHDAVYSLEIGAANIARQEGEELSMEDCLYALLLHSANEVANAIGEHVGGSIEGFAKMMNERAKEAGAKNSHFVNPSGLFDENHYTTAYDMAMVTRAVLQYPEFLRIEANTTYTIPKTNKNDETQPIVNRHKMLLPNDYRYYEGIQGGKTGYVDQSGNTLITIAKRGDLQLISVVMKSNAENVYNDTKLLLDYGFDNFHALNISNNETSFNLNESGFFDSINYLFDTTNTVANINEDDIVVIPKSSDFQDLTYQLNWSESDDSTANIAYYYGDRQVGNTTLTLVSSSSSKDNSNVSETLKVKEEKKGISIHSIKKVFFILLKVIGILLAFVVLIICILFIRAFIERRSPGYRRKRNRRKRRKRRASSVSSSHKRRTPRKPRY